MAPVLPLQPEQPAIGDAKGACSRNRVLWQGVQPVPYGIDFSLACCICPIHLDQTGSTLKVPGGERIVNSLYNLSIVRTPLGCARLQAPAPHQVRSVAALAADRQRDGDSDTKSAHHPEARRRDCAFWLSSISWLSAAPVTASHRGSGKPVEDKRSGAETPDFFRLRTALLPGGSSKCAGSCSEKSSMNPRIPTVAHGECSHLQALQSSLRCALKNSD